jgi:hypothetical protein
MTSRIKRDASIAVASNSALSPDISRVVRPRIRAVGDRARELAGLLQHQFTFLPDAGLEIFVQEEPRSFGAAGDE